MKRSAKGEREHRIYRLLLRSPAAGRVVEDRFRIESGLHEKPKRVWPLATVAHLFGISPSLLRKWVELGLLSRFRRPSIHHRSGLTERTVRAFLHDLSERAEWSVELEGSRRRPAEERCQKAVCGLQPGEALSPAEFAARAGVAVTTVRRLLAENYWKRFIRRLIGQKSAI